MHGMRMVHLPVVDVERPRTFFSDFGYAFDEKFCDARSLAVRRGENRFVTCTQTDFFDGFQGGQSVRTSLVISRW